MNDLLRRFRGIEVSRFQVLETLNPWHLGTLILISFLLSTSCFALSKSEIAALGEKFSAVIAPYSYKVGVSFIDIGSGQKVSVNGDRKYIAASVIKLPLMAAIFNLVDKDKLYLSEQLLLTDKYKLGGSGILQWVKKPTPYAINTLTQFMIARSDNTATKMLIDRIGLEELNAYFNSIGLNNTNIVDDTCLNEPPKPKINMTTPDDMSMLLLDIFNAKGFTHKSCAQMISFLKMQKYKWGINRGVPKSIVVANKTGNVDGVLNDTGIVYSENGPYIITILTNGFAKKRDARLVINKISEIAYDVFCPSSKLREKDKLEKKLYPKKKIKRYHKKRRVRR